MNVNVWAASAAGSFVEFLELAVIAYAIARSGYPQEALWGSIIGILGIIAISLPFGRVLQTIPLHFLQIAIGSILIVFGLRWMHKSIRRQVKNTRAGWMSENPLSAEDIILDDRSKNFNILNFWIVTKSAILETLEIAILVVTLGLASQAWTEAIGGAIAALLFSIIIVFILHNYLLNIPEVLIKLGAGVFLISLGTFWLGEGFGFDWFFGELSILAIITTYSLIAFAIVQWQKIRSQQLELKFDIELKIKE
ncbi:hypothetical protein IQ235_07685 [Oscillatoriales cyanobacterium LEGE 11467]|uniref:Uncharacterized protein n=1 Tax=Zarconia navalis LEGE 11467 TaxID=1828826 RepID=A0A928Z7L6_9CYAN|nr:hypothetical protein [Zarconia navalis]MBE9040660.1 hypothetical protein [Zarconia navalis LEGE 11467]